MEVQPRQTEVVVLASKTPNSRPVYRRRVLVITKCYLISGHIKLRNVHSVNEAMGRALKLRRGNPPAKDHAIVYKQKMIALVQPD
jgi:hypothetical protein